MSAPAHLLKRLFFMPFLAIALLVSVVASAPPALAQADPLDGFVEGDDVAFTEVDEVVDVDVMDNDFDDEDDLDMPAATMEIIDPSVDGEAEMVFTDDEPTARFVPNAGFEGLTKFRYRVCFGGTCFTFWVWIFVGNSRCTITGTNGDDVLVGTAGRDVICGRGGSDTIDGKGGNDIILGGKGADVITGGGGNDRIWGGKGADTIEGNGGNDRLRGGRGADVIKGGNGNDRIFGGRGADDLKGNSGDDLLVGRQGPDVLHGGADNDTIRGGRDADQIHGGKGADDISGGRGADLIDADNGSDTVRAGRGKDLVWGGNGVDDIRGNRGADVLFGGAGNDTVNGGNGSDECSGETLTNCEAELAAEDPSVTIAAPADGATVDPAGFTIEVAVEPAGPPVEILIDGEAVGIAEAPDYTLTVIGADLAAGSHLIMVESFFGSAESEIVVGAPAIAIASPKEGDPVDATGFDVAVIGGDGTPVDIAIDGTPVGQAIAPDYILTLTGLTLTEGAHVITATDGATIATTNVVVPTLALVAPADGGEVGTDGFEVVATLDPAVGPVSISVDGVVIDEATAPDYRAALSDLALAVGDHIVEVSAFGITRTVTVTVPADPVLEIIAPVAGPVANGDSIEVQLNVTPPGDPVDISIDGVVVGQALAPDYAVTLTGLGLTAGEHVLSVAANGLTAEVTFAVPVVSNLSIVSPAADEVVSSDELVVTIAGAAGDPVEVEMDGVSVGSISAPNAELLLTDLGLASGSHTITVTDPVGGSDTVDVIVPTLTLVSPAAGVLLNDDSVQVVASLTPAAGPVQVLLDGEILGEATAPDYTVDLTNVVVGGGDYTISVEAYGLTDSAQVEFPRLAISSPSDGTLIDANSLAVTGVSEPAGATVQFAIDGVSVGTATGPEYDVTLTGLAMTPGEHTLTATAHGETREVTFIVGQPGDGSEPPTIAPLDPLGEPEPDPGAPWFDPTDIDAGPGPDLSDRSDPVPVPLIPIETFAPIPADGIDQPIITSGGGADPLPAVTVTETVTSGTVELVGVPASLEVPDEAVAAGGQITLEILDPTVTRNLTRTGLAFDLRASGFGNDNPTVVQIPAGLPVAGEEIEEIDLGGPTPWVIRVPVDDVPLATDDARERLKITIHLGCDPTGLCRTTEDLDTTYDAETGMLEAAIPVGYLEGIGGPVAPAANLRAGDASTIGHQSAGGEGTAASVTSSVTGAAGDYSASEISLLSEWQVGIQTGEATTSYPIQAPAAPGPVPNLSLSYSSGSVDGITDEKNSQVGLVGAGWSMPNPAITRVTDLCNAIDEPSYLNNTCLPGGDDDGFSISMSGVSGRLVKTDRNGEDPFVHPFVAGATYVEYETETKNTARIWKVTADAGTGLAGNGGAVLEWWEVTTGDGTLNVFGRNRTFVPVDPDEASHFEDRVAAVGVPLNSTKVVPAYLADTTKADNEDCASSLCPTVIAWHLDGVIDASGNMQVRSYRKGLNHYESNVGGTKKIRAYDRSVSPHVIDYGQRYGQVPNVYEETPDAFRVRFDYAYRNPANSASASDADFVDTPMDLMCSATSCSKKSPSFFHDMRLHTIRTQAGDLLGTQSVLRQVWPDAPGAEKNATKMFLQNIQLQEGGREVINTVESANAVFAIEDALPMITYTPTFLENVVNHPNKMSPMAMPRIGIINTELGGAIKFTYDQPTKFGETSVTDDGGLETCGGATTSISNPTKPAVRVPCYMFPSGGARWFNKWVITRTETDADGNFDAEGNFDPVLTPEWNKSDNEIVTYEYMTPPDWAWSSSFEDQEVTDCFYCPWSSYRGHRQVRVTDKAGNITDHYTYTGMAEDPWSSSGNTQTLGERLPDDPAVRFKIPIQGVDVLYNTVDSQGQKAAVARYTSDGDPENPQIEHLRDITVNSYFHEQLSTEWPTSSRMTRSVEKVIGFAPGSKASEWFTLTESIYDQLGRFDRAIESGSGRPVNEGGSGPIGVRTNYSEYAFALAKPAVEPPALPADDVPYFVDLPIRNTLASGNAATAPANNNLTALDVSETFYDGNTTLAGTLTRGQATTTRDRTSITNSVAVFNDTTYAYDETLDSGVTINRGLVTTIDDGVGGVTSHKYHPLFGYLQETDGPIPNQAGIEDITRFDVNPALGFTSRVEAPNDQTTVLTSDGLGRTQTVTLPESLTNPSNEPSYIFTYELTPGNSPLRVRTDVLRDPGAAEYEYTTAWSFMDGFARNIQSQEQTQNGSYYNVTSMNYDNAGRQFRQTVPTITPGTGGVYLDRAFDTVAGSRTTYDTAGTTTVESMDAAGNAVTRTATQAKGLITTTTQALTEVDVRTTKEEYDVRGNMLSAEDAHGEVVNYEYDLRDRLLTILDVETQAGARRPTITNRYNTTTVKHSDSILEMEDPDLGLTKYTYDSDNRLETETSARNITLTNVYDPASRLIERKHGATIVSRWTYDAPGAVGLLSLSEHNTIDNGVLTGAVAKQVTYDERLRPDSTTWAVTTNPGTPNAEQTNGEITSEYRESGAVEAMVFPDGSQTSYAYDPVERVNEITHAISAAQSGETVAHGVQYNSRGQMVFVARGDAGSDEDPGADGLNSKYEYEDWSGRLLSSKTAVGLQPDPVDTFDRTNIGKLYRVLLNREADPNGKAFWEDALAGVGEFAGNPQTITQVADGIMFQLEFKGGTIVDENGDVIATIPKKWADYRNSPENQLIDVHGANAAFAEWVSERILDDTATAATKLDWKDRLNSPPDAPNYITRGELVWEQMDNNPTNPVIDPPPPEAGPVEVDAIHELAYEWDRVGNLTSTHETSVDLSADPPAQISQYQCYTYDDLDRLLTGFTTSQASCNNSDNAGPDPYDVTYNYDAIGNITSASGDQTVNGGYAYHPVKRHAVTNAGDNNYIYDEVGNQTTRVTGPAGSTQTQNLRYDLQNRLVAITGDGPDMTALYDAEGNRVYRKLGTEETFYFGAYQQRDGIDQITHSLGSETIGHTIADSFVAAASDHLGSGSVTLASEENPLLQRYTPFGQVRGANVNGLPVDETFTGQTDDPGTGLIDYNARHYDPLLGRFVMADRVLDGYNRYNYVHNNPLKYTDPSGNCSCSKGEYRPSSPQEPDAPAPTAPPSLVRPAGEGPYINETVTADDLIFNSDGSWNIKRAVVADLGATQTSKWRWNDDCQAFWCEYLGWGFVAPKQGTYTRTVTADRAVLINAVQGAGGGWVLETFEVENLVITESIFKSGTVLQIPSPDKSMPGVALGGSQIQMIYGGD